MTSRLNSNGTIQNAWITSVEVRLKRTVRLVGITSNGSPLVPWPGSQGCPVISTLPAADPGTWYCGYWNDQLHWKPVTLTTTLGLGGSRLMKFSSRAVKKNRTPTMMNGTTVYSISIGRL